MYIYNFDEDSTIKPAFSDIGTMQMQHSSEIPHEIGINYKGAIPYLSTLPANHKSPF